MPKIPVELARPINCPDALDLIESIFADAIASGKHQPGDWRDLRFGGNEARFSAHYYHYRNERWGAKPTGDDHLANLVCRGLLLLQLRIEASKKS